MNRGCLTALIFVLVTLGTFLVYVIVVMAMTEPGPPSDNGGRAMGMFMFALLSGPIVALIAGGIAAFFTWRGSPPGDSE